MPRQTAISAFENAAAFYRVHWRPLLLGGTIVVSGLAIATMLLGPVATFFLTALTAGFYATTYSLVDTGKTSWRLFPETLTKRVVKLVTLYLVLSLLTLILTAIGAGILIVTGRNAFATVQSTALFGLITTPVAGFIVATGMRFVLVVTIREGVGFLEAVQINGRIWRSYPSSILTYTLIRGTVFVIPVAVASAGLISALPSITGIAAAVLMMPFILSFMYTYHLIFYENIATRMGAPWRVDD